MSTRKQKAREKRSRQSGVQPDRDYMERMLGTFPRSNLESDQGDRDINVGLESVGTQQNINQNGEDFKSLLNTNSRENSEITIETASMIYTEIASQITKKLDETKIELNSQLLTKVYTVFTEQVFSSIQNTIGAQGQGRNSALDRESGDLQKSLEVKY